MSQLPTAPAGVGPLVEIDGLRVSQVMVRTYPVSPIVASVKGDYEVAFGAEPENRGGWYRPDDWGRVSFVLDSLDRGGRILDVGVGAGQFINAIARSGWYDDVVGMDKLVFNKYTEFEDGIQVSAGDIAALDYPDNSFDVVTCMEVLEHVPPEVFTAGLAELRRVCRGQLVMSVPFREPEPISKTHVRRFEADDVIALFPDADYALLDRQRMPWVIMTERCGDDSAAVRSADAGRIVQLATEVAHLRAVQKTKAPRGAVLVAPLWKRVLSRSALVRKVGYAVKDLAKRVRSRP